MIKGFLSICLAISLVSCVTREICDEDNQSELVVRFKMERDGSVTDTIVSSVSVYGIRSGNAFGLLYDSITASRIVLPMDPNGTTTSFVLQVGNQLDTINIHHNTEYYLISFTCGFAALFTIFEPESSGNVIRQIQVISPVVDAELIQNEEHLWLYF